MSRILLLGCGKAKARSPQVAADLYRGSLFLARRAYADAVGSPWYVLSAKHGLVHPGQVLDPYDCSLAGVDRLDALGWALGVVRQLFDEVPDGTSPRDLVFELHAGRDYAEDVRDILRACGASVSWPVEGLGLPAQRAWYGEATRRARLGGAA